MNHCASVLAKDLLAYPTIHKPPCHFVSLMHDEAYIFPNCTCGKTPHLEAVNNTLM